jgi:hypothetical protein
VKKQRKIDIYLYEQRKVIFMARLKYEPKDLTDRIVGRDVWDLSQISQEKITDPEDKATLKRALIYLYEVGIVFGITIGAVGMWTLFLLMRFINYW